MSANKTLAEMRAATLRYADLEGYAADEAIVDDLLNARLARLYDLLIMGRPEHYYETSVAISAVKDQSTYAWAADWGIQDFYRLVALIADDGTDYYELPNFDWSERARLLRINANSGTSSVTQLSKRLRPVGIEILPAPHSATVTLTLHYVPAYEPLTEDAQTFDGVNGWEQHAELMAAADLRIKNEMDPSGVMATAAQVEAAIAQLAGTRDHSRPIRIKRTDQRRQRRRMWRRGYGEEY